MTNVGTQLKIAVALQCADLTMDDYNFTCEFFTCANHRVVVDKSEMKREASTAYIAIVDTAQLTAGEIRMRVTAIIPDEEIEGGERKEVTTTTTNIILSR